MHVYPFLVSRTACPYKIRWKKLSLIVCCTCNLSADQKGMKETKDEDSAVQQSVRDTSAQGVRTGHYVVVCVCVCVFLVFPGSSYGGMLGPSSREEP